VTPGAHDLGTRVRSFADRHDLLPAGHGVLALVSGGADSTALMHVLPRVHDGPVHVLSFDHGLRAGSAGEARDVAARARALGLPAHVEHLGLAPGPHALERAREARLAAAERVRAGLGLDAIATGHTRTDHVETILFRAARGTGRTGALGIAPRRGRLVRPLLGVSRDETREWCREHGVPFVDDPTNDDMATARARVRLGLLPAFRAVHPSAEANLARMAELLADEADVVEAAVAVAGARVRRDGGLDAHLLAAEPVAIARILVRGLLADAGFPGDALSAEAVDAVLARARSGAGSTQVPGGLVAVDRGLLVAEGAGREAQPIVPMPLPVPGMVHVAGTRLSARAGVAVPGSGADAAWVRPEGALVVRAPAPGDRVGLAGGGHQSLGRMLAAAGVPARRRHAVAVVADRRGVVWVPGYRVEPSAVAMPGQAAVALRAVAA
jgi:tRNA(Ile)-lysidine synthase